jgi:hypothetical protein
MNSSSWEERKARERTTHRCISQGCWDVPSTGCELVDIVAQASEIHDCLITAMSIRKPAELVDSEVYSRE